MSFDGHRPQPGAGNHWAKVHYTEAAELIRLGQTGADNCWAKGRYTEFAELIEFLGRPLQATTGRKGYYTEGSQ